LQQHFVDGKQAYRAYQAEEDNGHRKQGKTLVREEKIKNSLKC